MPRTKVSKSSKRSREVSNVRIYEKQMDSYMEQLESTGSRAIMQVENHILNLLSRTPTELLQMKMADVLDFEKFLRFKDWTEDKNGSKSLSSTSSSATSFNKHHSSAKVTSNPSDEGYLTEDSAPSSFSVVSAYSQMRHPAADIRGRAQGPLNSARARKQRRSRSACDETTALVQNALLTAVNSNAAVSEHMARSKMRTPVARLKALSADRSHKPPQSPALAFLRWPKPGETVLSQSCSTVVAQVLPDKFANVNIPVLNGVLSLRPKKISELQPGIVSSIGKETLDQIKTLHANLDFIMTMAERGGLN